MKYSELKKLYEEEYTNEFQIKLKDLINKKSFGYSFTKKKYIKRFVNVFKDRKSVV